MIGDLVLWIKQTWKQQTCIHDYRVVNRLDNGGSYEVCNKCEHLR